VNEFNDVKSYGASIGSARTADETAVARFWTVNVIRTSFSAASLALR
jgi:hypothetical protein